MGFNAGAFAGALGQSALSTYERIGEEELRAMQRQKFKQELEDQAATSRYLAEAAQEKNYTGGTDISQAIGQATASYDPETAKTVQGILANQTQDQLQSSLRAYGGAEGMATPQTQAGALDLSKVGVYQGTDGKTMASNEGTALSAGEQYRYAANKALKEGRLGSVKELLPVAAAARTEERAAEEDDFSKWMKNSNTQVQKDPVGFVEKHLVEYNKAKKGSPLDDGLTGSVVKGADGSSSFVQINKNNKVVSSTPITPQTAMQAFEMIAFSKYTSLPGKYKEAMELRINQKKADIEEEFKVGKNGKPGVYERTQMADAAAKAASGYNKVQPIGVTKDNTQMIMSDGSVRPMPKGVTRDDLFPKATGAKINPAVETKLAEQFALEVAGAKPADLPAIQKKYQGLGLDTKYQDQTKAALGNPEPGRTFFGPPAATKPTPAPVTPTAIPASAPAQPTTSIDRLTNRMAAVGNNPQQLRAFTDEVEKDLPRVQGEIKTLKGALNVVPETDRPALTAKIYDLEQELNLYGSILGQRKAKQGF